MQGPASIYYDHEKRKDRWDQLGWEQAAGCCWKRRCPFEKGGENREEPELIFIAKQKTRIRQNKYIKKDDWFAIIKR